MTAWRGAREAGWGLFCNCRRLLCGHVTPLAVLAQISYASIMAKIIQFPLEVRRRERPALSAAPVYAMGVLGLVLSVWAIAVVLSWL